MVKSCFSFVKIIKNFWRPNSPYLCQFGPKLVIFEFSAKNRNRHFFRLQRLDFVEKLGNSNARFSIKNAKNTVFGHFGTKRAKLGPKGAIFQNKKIENSNARFRRKSGGRREIERQTERQRQWRIYRQESAQWASDQQASNTRVTPPFSHYDFLEAYFLKSLNPFLSIFNKCLRNENLAF